MAQRDVIVVGASAGGLQALQDLLLSLPTDLDAAILIAIHRQTVRGKDLLPGIVRRHSRMTVISDIDGQTVRPQYIYVSPPEGHLRIQSGILRVFTGLDAATGKSIDALFTDAAKAYGERVIGILLSGTMNDGTAGCWEIRKHGGVTIVQEPQEAAYPAMPQNAMQDVPIDFCLHANEIGSKLKDLIARRSEAPSQRRARVMVVEDEWLLASELEQQLSELGYEVVATVPSGEEALAAATTKDPEIVIMDVGLSGRMKGTEVAKELWDKLHVPIIFLTGHADQTTVMAAQSCMPYAFLPKPHHAGQLHSTIQLALFRRGQELRKTG